MSDYTQKVLWGEGMLLTPHHLQQSDRYLEDLVHRRVRAIHALDWGLLHMRFDAEALTGGELSVVEGSCVFPEGVHVSFPGRDAPPISRKIDAAYPAGAASLGVYLAVPRTQPGELMCRTDPSSEALTPYDKGQATVKDDADTAQQREIPVARKRLRVLFTSEPREAYSCLPIAVVRRTATGGFEFDEQFIPTCQYASASARLMGMLRRLLEVMVKKSEDLSSQRRQRGDGMVDLSASESAGFWFLHTINQNLPTVRSLFQQPRVHPSVVHRELSRLAGALYTFSTAGTPNDIPTYNPDDLTSSFLPLEAQLLNLLGTVMPSRIVPIPLERTREMVYSARIHDERLMSDAKWIMGVMTNVPPEKVIGELPVKAKLSSSDHVDALIVRAMPGLRLVHLDPPPGEVPVKAGRVYFQLATEGNHWDAIKASGTLSVYIPAEFTGLKLELMALKD